MDTPFTIGDFNHFKEGVNISCGIGIKTEATRTGDHNFLMAHTHIGHDCTVGNHSVFVTNAILGPATSRWKTGCSCPVIRPSTSFSASAPSP